MTLVVGEPCSRCESRLCNLGAFGEPEAVKSPREMAPAGSERPGMDAKQFWGLIVPVQRLLPSYGKLQHELGDLLHGLG